MSKSDIDAFLDVGGGEPAPEPEPAPVPEPVETRAEPEPAPAPEPEPELEPAIDTDNFRKLRAAVEATKKERNDYKGERDRLAGELAAYKAQLDAARQAPPPVAREAPPPQAIPNPIEDPEGFIRYQDQRRFSDRLDMSETMLREQLGDEEVDAKIDVYKKAVADNPALNIPPNHRHPWKWAYDQGKRLIAAQEIGDDPAAYRTKLEAEIRAKVEAEMAGNATQAAAPRVALPRSLSSVTSAAPRSAPAQAPEWEDIWDRKNRK